MSHIVKLRAPSVSAFDTEMPDDYPTPDTAPAPADGEGEEDEDEDEAGDENE
jgi:hypothetical protein